MIRIRRATLSIALGIALLIPLVSGCAGPAEAASTSYGAPAAAISIHVDRRPPADTARPTIVGMTHTNPEALAGLLLLLAARSGGTVHSLPRRLTSSAAAHGAEQRTVGAFHDSLLLARRGYSPPP